MKNLFSVVAVILLGVTVSFAQYSAASLSQPGTYSVADPPVTIKGYLMDEPCAAAHMNALDSAGAEHPTGCSLKAAEDVFGMVYKGQWVPFDEKGSKKAAELVKKSTKTEGVTVSVTGAVRGNRFVVSHIKETKKL
jgi:hypothetical protein